MVINSLNALNVKNISLKKEELHMSHCNAHDCIFSVMWECIYNAYWFGACVCVCVCVCGNHSYRGGARIGRFSCLGKDI